MLTYNGKTFRYITGLHAYLKENGVIDSTLGSLSRMLKCTNNDVEAAIGRMVGRNRGVEYKGVHYGTVKELSISLGFKSYAITQHMYEYKLSMCDAIELLREKEEQDKYYFDYSVFIKKLSSNSHKFLYGKLTNVGGCNA